MKIESISNQFVYLLVEPTDFNNCAGQIKSCPHCSGEKWQNIVDEDCGSFNQYFWFGISEDCWQMRTKRLPSKWWWILWPVSRAVEKLWRCRLPSGQSTLVFLLCSPQQLRWRSGGVDFEDIVAHDVLVILVWHCRIRSFFYFVFFLQQVNNNMNEGWAYSWPAEIPASSTPLSSFSASVTSSAKVTGAS